MSKTCCQERHCDWVGDTSEMLSAPHPFIKGDLITACPKCKTLESSLWDACDAEGCTRAGRNNAMTEGKKDDWDFVKARFDQIRQQYLDLDGVPGVNVQFALQLTFAPLAVRYNSGERTDELYLEMMEVV